MICYVICYLYACPYTSCTYKCFEGTCSIMLNRQSFPQNLGFHTKPFVHKNLRSERAQYLGPLAAIVDDLNSVPRTHMKSHNSLSFQIQQIWHPLLASRDIRHVRSAQTYMQLNSHRHKVKIYKSWRKFNVYEQ